MENSTIKLFSVFDKISSEIVDFGASVNASAFIRARLPYLIGKYSLDDITLIEIGVLDKVTSNVSNIENIPHSWNEYKFPETRAEALSKLEIEEITHTKKEE